ncbi:MAG: hypothetical protein ACLTR4_13140 [Gallintestinimicrobium sp.]
MATSWKAMPGPGHGTMREATWANMSARAVVSQQSAEISWELVIDRWCGWVSNACKLSIVGVCCVRS